MLFFWCEESSLIRSNTVWNTMMAEKIFYVFYGIVVLSEALNKWEEIPYAQ